jgi:hypothetical protein
LAREFGEKNTTVVVQWANGFVKNRAADKPGNGGVEN